jgi:alginate O-acetyltransferase complex protein AlgI
MLFHTLDFAIFFPVVFILYWFVCGRNFKIQNTLLLISSYYFYSCWDWRFLFLLMFSTILDYYTGLKIEENDNPTKRKFWLWLSVGINLGFLGIFKYYNFFITSFAESISLLGVTFNPWTLKIILPVGISFYTFHGLSYVIDIYKKRIVAEKSFVDYSVFVSFFPLLVAGPIERATHLLPQIKKERIFSYPKAIDGLRQILWGLFKKVVIADQCAIYANMIFNNTEQYNGPVLFLGAIFFAFQIYGDFSGYSDIALGTARLLGIELLKNFSFPYFSRDIAEFWRRWHISLSSWFKDYLYIPLGGSKGGKWMRIRNTFAIFLVSGFWHGANWTFIVWGLLHALYFIPLLLLGKNRNNIEVVANGRMFPSLKETVQIGSTFVLATFAWIFFRAESITHAFVFIKNMFSGIFTKQAYIDLLNFIIYKAQYQVFIFIVLFFLIEWIGREKEFALAKFGLNWNPILRWSFYIVLFFWVLALGGDKNEFIYFQF